MTQALVDQPARDRIRGDLDATLVVEAAAGTGKTTEMIRRIIAVIRAGATTLERIVAVTFTEKAAGEMKLRLRTELEDARRKATDDTEHDRFVAALAELEVARIGTIHSFCADLLRERPIEARIDPVFEVAAEDESERLFSRAFERWFQTSVAHPGEGVRRILRRNDPTELLRTAGWSLVQRRDFDGAWRRDPFEREPAIDAALAELATLGGLGAQADSPKDPLGQLFTKLDRWLAELGRRELVRPRDYDGLEAELSALCRWWEWRPTGKSKLYGANLMRADVIARRDEVKATLERFLELADADLAALLREELRPLVQAYEDLKARTGKLDFIDLLADARNLLRDDRRVREEMQARFTHFFVDEFQDTDPLQVEILLLLCADDPAIAEPAHVHVKPGKLFIVGDPKQAIYRFRRADIALYESIKRRLLDQGATLLHLTTSFRSVPHIQSAVNAAFTPIMAGGQQAQYVPLENFRADTPTQPAVIALPVPNPYGWRDITQTAIEDSYPDAVGAFIDYLINQSGWTVAEGDKRVPITTHHICLVFRRFQSYRKDLTRPYVRALEARQIPHVLLGGRSFHEREEIEAARNALRAIEWPDDEFSVYATLRGPFFSFHDEDLVAYRHARRALNPLALARPDFIAPTTDADRAIVAALQILADLHRHRNHRPIAATLSRLLAETRAHAGVAIWPAGEQALANIFRVADLARRFEANGATSFRAFIDRLDSDADRGKQPDAPVVEEGTEGVRIMTVHASKGLEFPIVILCDPTAPLESDRPSRFIDTERRVWLESLAGCVPVELREHADEVTQRDKEEIERLAYVAVTRARDLLVVPVVGDEERTSWLLALNPVVHPQPSLKRSPLTAHNCPKFGNDSVVERSRNTQLGTHDSVQPGRHVPRAGTHAVVWWDPRALTLNRELGGGLRQSQVLEADESNERALASEAAHAAWIARRDGALVTAARKSVISVSVTEEAKTATLAGPLVTVHETQVDRRNRPGGKRFGTLVHATLAAVDLRGNAEHVQMIATNQARLIGASAEEIAAAVVAVTAALAHPLMVRAANADRVRREVPVVMDARMNLVEGVIDLAFAEGERWIVVDFKTDGELALSRSIYETQVQLYARALAASEALLLMV
ncbi:MAG: UvrD-helicase domain-containing protein [Kofleriaceae bacterium]|nr:UvrD-helicase domain-containing protein [Kofleriaceae bacterium]